jgi:uncharacterized protein (TIGR02996 family)
MKGREGAMTPEIAFVQAILEDPEDLDQRRIFADWLEDQGGDLALRGELMRLQCDLSAGVPDVARRDPMRRREAALWERLREAWLGPLAEHCSEARVVNGLLRVAMSAEQFCQEPIATAAAGLFRRAWVETVRLDSPAAYILDIAQSPALRTVSALDLSGRPQGPRLENARLQVFLQNAAHFPRLTRLNLANRQLTDGAIALLDRKGWLTKLTSLDVRNNRLSNEGVRFLLERAAPRLREIEVHGNDALNATTLEFLRNRRLSTNRLVNSVGMELVRIPAGSYLMGSPEGEASRLEDEGIQHEVEITRPFYLGAFLVTQQQYQQVMNRNPSDFGQGDQHSPSMPVENVSHAEAREFCDRLGQLPGEEVFRRNYRLATEAEWEWACRAGGLSGQAYAFGSSFRQGWIHCTSNKPDIRNPLPVGSFPPNDWGLYDMHGNCWDWCNDWYSDSYYQASPRENPQGPAAGDRLVLRGGSWFNASTLCRSASRFGTTPSGSNCIGFRVALSIED